MPEFCLRISRPPFRGRRESRVPIAPMGPVQKKHGGRTTGSTGITPAFPAQWFTAYNALPGDRAFLPPSSLRSLLPRNLMPASGHQDHTALPSASGAVRYRRFRVHRIPPRGRDDRVSPLVSTKSARMCKRAVLAKPPVRWN
jgi:hypothetical protein